MEIRGNGTEPKSWLPSSVTSAAHYSCDIYQAVHTSDFLVTLQLFANEANGLESLRGTWKAFPWSAGMEESFPGLQEVERSAAFYLIFNTGPQAVPCSVACSQETKQYFAVRRFLAFVIKNRLALLCKSSTLSRALCAPFVLQNLLGRVSQKKR